MKKFARGALLRCPRCGGGHLRRSYTTLVDRCPTCGLALERGEAQDFWIGAFAINLVVAESIAVLLALVCLLAAWPSTTLATCVGLGAALAMPYVFYPFSRTLWLAWDLVFRPVEAGDDK